MTKPGSGLSAERPPRVSREERSTRATVTTDSYASFARCRRVALEHELLQPLSVLHFGDVEVAFLVDVHVMHHIELAGADAVASKRIERLERLAVEHPDPRRAARGHIEIALLGIMRKGRARDRLAVAAMWRFAIAVDEHLVDVFALEREHLHALAAAVGHINEPIIRHPCCMDGAH